MFETIFFLLIIGGVYLYFTSNKNSDPDSLLTPLERRQKNARQITAYAKRHKEPINNPKNKKGNVYIFRNSKDRNEVKIGVTAGDPHKRAFDIKADREAMYIGCDFEALSWVSVEKSYEVEFKVHENLGDLHLYGEVFNISPEQALEEIKQAAKEMDSKIYEIFNYEKAKKLKNIFLEKKYEQEEKEVSETLQQWTEEGFEAEYLFLRFQEYYCIAGYRDNHLPLSKNTYDKFYKKLEEDNNKSLSEKYPLVDDQIEDDPFSYLTPGRKRLLSKVKETSVINDKIEKKIEANLLYDIPKTDSDWDLECEDKRKFKIGDKIKTSFGDGKLLEISYSRDMDGFGDWETRRELKVIIEKPNAFPHNHGRRIDIDSKYVKIIK